MVSARKWYRLARRRRALYDRNPLVFWKVLSASLVILVTILLAWALIFSGDIRRNWRPNPGEWQCVVCCRHF